MTVRDIGRKILPLSGLAFALVASGCGRRRPPEPAVITEACTDRDVTVEGLGAERDGIGVFALRGSVCPVDRDSGLRALFDRLLFAGVSRSSQPLPMLDRPEDYRRTPPEALTTFRRERWSEYVQRVNATSSNELVVRLDLPGIRRWLEQNNLARKFGLP